MMRSRSTVGCLTLIDERSQNRKAVLAASLGMELHARNIEGTDGSNDVVSVVGPGNNN